MSEENTKADERVRAALLERHNDECSMIASVLAGQAFHPWRITGKFAEMVVKGRGQRGSLRWLELRCADESCPARAMISEDDLLRNAVPKLEPIEMKDVVCMLLDFIEVK